MQDRDAYIAIDIDYMVELAINFAMSPRVDRSTIWMPDRSFEFHFRRHQRIVLREREPRLEESSSVEFAVVGDH